MNSVLFLQPFLGRREKVIFPIGLHALYCHLAARRPDLDLGVLDQNAAPDPDAALAAALGERRPDLVCISLRNKLAHSVSFGALGFCLELLSQPPRFEKTIRIRPADPGL